MPTYSPQNERLKRRYLAHLKAAKGLSEASLDAVVKALHRFEQSTNFRDFRKFHIEQAIAFRQKLEKQIGESGKPLSASTTHQTLNLVRGFILWLAGQPGYRSRIRYSDSEYFRLSEKETRIAKAVRSRPVPTIEQINSTLLSMPANTEIELRNRAAMAFILLTGARDGSAISLKLKHISLAEGVVFQDTREVNTKNSKTFSTWFFPVDGPALEIFEKWHKFLTAEKLWSSDDPLFPATEITNGADCRFCVKGLARKHWSNATSLRTIFREAFEKNGLQYFHPHSFRKTLTVLGQTVCQTPEAIKAWSQNLGHAEVMTTMVSYGEVPAWRQAELMKTLTRHRVPTLQSDLTDLVAGIVKSELAKPRGI